MITLKVEVLESLGLWIFILAHMVVASPMI
jgi:hypothetical protein